MITHELPDFNLYILDPGDDLPDDAPVGSQAIRQYPFGSYPPGSRSADKYFMSANGWMSYIEAADMPESMRWNQLFEKLDQIERRLKDIEATH